MLTDFLREHQLFLDVFCIATGAMVSSGIFVLPGIAHARAGSSVVISYLVAGLLVAIGMLNTIELSTAMPKAGGDYFFIARSLGPAVGAISGLLNWFALSLKSAFALIGIAAFLRLFVDIDFRIAGLGFCAFFVMINLLGTRHAGRLQVALVTGLLLLMAYYVVRGLPHVKMANLQPFAPFGIHQTLATAGFVFVAYGGLINISSVAEEIKNPSRTIPYGMLTSLVVVAVLYGLMVFVTTGVLPSTELDHSLTPITDGAGAFLGIWGVRAIGVGAVFAFFSTGNAGIMAASRYLFALSKDDLMPKGLSRLGRRSKVPTASVLLTGLFVGSTLFLKLDILVEAASLVLILGFILSCVCVIVLRESLVQNYRPSFKAPFYPFPQVIGILGFGLLIVELGLEAYLIIATLFSVAIIGYFLFGRRRLQRDYALLHVLERLTSKELVSGSLERELKQIVRERDAITLDRFDEIVNRAPVLDISENITFDKCARYLAEAMSKVLKVPEENVYRELIYRETDTSSVLTPFLAVPRIIIPGSGQFEIALLRNVKGVRFSSDYSDIRAMFVLAGTCDERNFHLRSLAAIAQFAETPEFESLWLSARGKDEIRDLVLLATRRRMEPHTEKRPVNDANTVETDRSEGAGRLK
jgi:APA family basic amino acid/polyamine antiporter